MYRLKYHIDVKVHVRMRLRTLPMDFARMSSTTKSAPMMEGTVALTEIRIACSARGAFAMRLERHTAHFLIVPTTHIIYTGLGICSVMTRITLRSATMMEAIVALTKVQNAGSVRGMGAFAMRLECHTVRLMVI